MEVPQGALLHFQWTGSDFNPNRGPNNAEGWRYSDRMNLLEVADDAQNFPVADARFQAGERTSFFANTETRKRFALLGQEAILAAKGGACGDYEDGDDNEQNDPRNCGKLNAAPAHFDGGLVPVHHAVGSSFHFVSTRNNNFSNRAQKWQLSVVRPEWRMVDTIKLLGGLMLAAAVLAVVALYLRQRGYCQQGIGSEGLLITTKYRTKRPKRSKGSSKGQSKKSRSSKGSKGSKRSKGSATGRTKAETLDLLV